MTMEGDAKVKARKSFEDLLVWQKGLELVKEIYIQTKDGKLNRDVGLRDQLRRAAISVPTNIAEGYERASRKEYLHFLNIAKASAGEVRSLLRVALEIGYLDKLDHDALRDRLLQLSRFLANQIKSLRVTDP